MNKEAYDRLIDALDALPEGFPRTPSGSEYRMIEDERLRTWRML